MIELTAQAAAHLRMLVEERGLDTSSSGLRLSVEKGGCAGLHVHDDNRRATVR